MKTIESEKKLLTIIRILTGFFILALIVSGSTAFPLETELSVICRMLEGSPGFLEELHNWFASIYEGVSYTNAHYPFIMYGCDWLAFAHIIIAVAFLGVYFKPVRNIWIVYFGMIACLCVIPTIIICGAVRDIPVFWQIVDSSFGILGIIPLLILRHYIKKLAIVSGYVEQKY